jgi:hypothetical protein
MNEYADNSWEDSLARVVEAFADQSVPEGPDEFTKRRLVAALREADGRYASAADRHMTSPKILSMKKRQRRYLGLAAAATVAAAATAGVLSMTASHKGDPAVAVEQLATTDAPTSDEDARIRALVAELQRLHLDRGRVLDKKDVWEVARAIIEANPKLAKSESWRLAQEKLGDALERPEVIGLSFGVISTLPQIARF